jgi:hypothetical protein
MKAPRLGGNITISLSIITKLYEMGGVKIFT